MTTADESLIRCCHGFRQAIDVIQQASLRYSQGGNHALTICWFQKQGR